MASSSLAVRVLPEVERGLAFSAIAGSVYVAVGTPLSHPATTVVFQNQTDAKLSFSFDGVDSAISLAAGDKFVFDVQSTKGKADTYTIAKGTQFWVKRTTAVDPTAGFAFISVFYGAGLNTI